MTDEQMCKCGQCQKESWCKRAIKHSNVACAKFEPVSEPALELNHEASLDRLKPVEPAPPALAGIKQTESHYPLTIGEFEPIKISIQTLIDGVFKIGYEQGLAARAIVPNLEQIILAAVPDDGYWYKFSCWVTNRNGKLDSKSPSVLEDSNPRALPNQDQDSAKQGIKSEEEEKQNGSK
jgi:hypothetical protein